MITPAQIRAARALLNMSQKELGQRVGIAPNTVSAFETETINPSLKRLKDIQNCLENAGIEFLDDGLRLRKASVQTYEGREGFAEFRLDVLEEVKRGNPDICVSNVDERMFDKWGSGEVNNHYRSTMVKLIKENSEIRSRVIVQEGDLHLSARNNAEYRWMPKSEFGDFPFYIYGNKTAMIPFTDNELQIYIINHTKITDFFRRQFNEKWSRATITN